MGFAHCINSCHLNDLGFKGLSFTWKRGDLRERLDRVLCNQEWQVLFPNSNVTNVPLASSAHCGLWLSTSVQQARGNASYFKFLAPGLIIRVSGRKSRAHG